MAPVTGVVEPGVATTSVERHRLIVICLENDQQRHFNPLEMARCFHHPVVQIVVVQQLFDRCTRERYQWVITSAELGHAEAQQLQLQLLFADGLVLKEQRLLNLLRFQ